MANEITITVYKPGGRKFFYAQWVDPVTGKKMTRSTGKERKKDADRVAGELLLQLREERLDVRRKMPWAEFRERYESDVVASQAAKTAATVTTTFNSLERLINPQSIQVLDANQISNFQRLLRNEEKSEATIKSYLTHLKAALNWAVRMKFIRTAPAFTMPKRVTKMKGRPITTEEFERILCKVEDVVGKECEDSWKFLLKGLWASGLRLGEALQLSWKETAKFAIDLSGKRPMFRIAATAEKGKKNRLLPMAPEFAEMLSAIPNSEQIEFVFAPKAQRGGSVIRRVDTVSSIIVEIGQKAGVKVNEKSKNKTKYASAHDLRRSFGFRWAMRVMPPVLMQLMRHESIQTTQEFYVGRNAEAAADIVWAAFGEIQVKRQADDKQENSQTENEARLS